MNRLGARLTLLSLVALAGFVAPACSPGAPAKVVRPDAPTGAAALGSVDVACRPGAHDAEPYVVDLPSSARLDLEVAMKGGVAIVSYDCKTLKLLKGCSVPSTTKGRVAGGGYRFAGVSRKEEVIQLDDQNEIAANLPFSGVQLAGGLNQGATLDLALVLVGKRSTVVDGVTRPELEGSCDGATHFVRAATVGAFALEVGTRGEVRAVAEMLGAGASAKSTSSRKSMNRDGDLGDCRKASPDDATPPGQCGAAIRLELAPVGAGRPEKSDGGAPAKDAATPLPASCPAGMSMSGGRCTADLDGAFLCAADDEAQCKAQCEKGSPGSCYNLALILEKKPSEMTSKAEIGEIEAYHRKRYETYKPLLQRACDGGVGEGCDRLAFVQMALKAPDKDVEDAWQRACNLGLGHSCRLFAGRFLYDEKRRDVPRGRALLERSCKLGVAYGCVQLGETYLQPVDGTQPTPEGVKKGLEVMSDACSAKSVMSCNTLGRLHAEGKGVPKDEAEGLRYYERACDLGNTSSCAEVGAMILLGKGATKDEKRAEAYFDKACPAKGDMTCASLGGFFRKGDGKDPKRAFGFYDRACTGSGYACNTVADMLLAGEGVTKDKARAFAMYERICKEGGQRECLLVADDARKTDKKKAKDLYQQACDKGLVEGCKKLEAMGGKPTAKKP